MLLEITDVISGNDLSRLRDGVGALRFMDGRKSAGDHASRVKHNREAVPARGQWEQHARSVMEAVLGNATFLCYALPRKMVDPLFNRYEKGMGYGAHTDVSIMDMGRPQVATRTDLSFTLFLSEPGSYDGGELVVCGDYGDARFKPAAGSMVVYPSGQLHRVEEVTRGVRLAAVGWVQSYVRDPEQRALLYDAYRALEAARAEEPPVQERIDSLSNLYNRLLRMWSET